MLAAAALVAYLIKPGDTLSGIAASHGVKLAAVEGANSQIKNPDLIFAGQTIKREAIQKGAAWLKAFYGREPRMPADSKAYVAWSLALLGRSWVLIV